MSADSSDKNPSPRIQAKDSASIQRSFKEQFSIHTERGAALSVSAALDNRLADALKARLISSNLKTGMFKEGGAISNFGVRIRLAYLMGIISKEVLQEMEIIRDIRNKFAHDEFIHSFKHKDINYLCKQLTLLEKIKLRDHQDRRMLLHFVSTDYDTMQDSFRFVATCAVVAIILLLETDTLTPIRTPRF